jgi:uncharacterized membrane protein YozB (DUF420 family)
MDYFLIAQINLVLQVAIVAILVTSYLVKRRGKFLQHGVMMAAGIALSMVSFLLVMGPSLYSLGLGGSLFENLPFNTSVTVVLHASFGSVAEILGLWIVASWRFKLDYQLCVKRKKVMRVTFLLWLTSLLLGIALFAQLYQ